MPYSWGIFPIVSLSWQQRIAINASLFRPGRLFDWCLTIKAFSYYLTKQVVASFNGVNIILIILDLHILSINTPLKEVLCQNCSFTTFSYSPFYYQFWSFKLFQIPSRNQTERSKLVLSQQLFHLFGINFLFLWPLYHCNRVNKLMGH